MDIHKVRFTNLQQEVLRFLFVKPDIKFTERSLARNLDVSPTAVSNSLAGLEKENLVKVARDKESGRLSIELNRENPRIFSMKRVENLRNIYESGLADYLSDKFPGSTIIIFGSYSYGEDSSSSDIDIAVIGSSKKSLDAEKFEKTLERKVSVNFYESIGGIRKNLRENILNGIIISGGVKL